MIIELLAPHTDAGQEYAPGHVLDMAEPQATWLIDIGVARLVQAPQPSASAHAGAPGQPAPSSKSTRKGE